MVICFKVRNADVEQVWPKSSVNGCYIAFYKGGEEGGLVSEYQELWLKEDKTLKHAKDIASMVDGAVIRNAGGFGIMMANARYLAAVAKLKESLKFEPKPFVGGVVKVVKGFDVAVRDECVLSMARAMGWAVHVETAWTYKVRMGKQ